MLGGAGSAGAGVADGDPGPRTVRVGGGAKGVDVLAALNGHSVQVLSGTCATVGVGGFVLGGGHGPPPGRPSAPARTTDSKGPGSPFGDSPRKMGFRNAEARAREERMNAKRRPRLAGTVPVGGVACV